MKLQLLGNICEDTMTEMKKTRGGCRFWFRLTGVGFLVLFLVAGVSQTGQAARMQQKTFATPESAVDALIIANRNSQLAELQNILGPQSNKLIFSGDAVADKEGRKKFVKAYDAAHQLENNGEDRRILVVGPEKWPLPIPLVRRGEVWRFDTAAGELEILNRRIGRNELSVIRVCRAYVEAQREFAERSRREGRTVEYARKLHSAKGQHDGLFWQVKPGEEESPFGPLIAVAETEGYGEAAVQPREPYHGYYFKILTAQGEDASGGARKYVIDNRMINGFALIAFPAKYGDSGVMTFIINQDGIVYEKNLGPKTATIARRVVQYNPDATWKIYKSADLKTLFVPDQGK